MNQPVTSRGLFCPTDVHPNHLVFSNHCLHYSTVRSTRSPTCAAAVVRHYWLLIVLTFTRVAALKKLLKLLQNTQPVREVPNAKPL